MLGFAFIPGVFGCFNHQVLDPVHDDAELLSEHKLKLIPQMHLPSDKTHSLKFYLAS